MTEQGGLLSRVTNSAASIAGVMIIALLVSQFIIVILRYIFSYGIPWGLDLLIYLFLAQSLLPLPLVILENHNVRVDVFYQGYSSTKKTIIDRMGLGFLLFPSFGYAAYVSWAPMLNSWRLLESSPALEGLPGYYLLKTLVFITFASVSMISLVLAMKKRPWDYKDNTEEVSQ